VDCSRNAAGDALFAGLTRCARHDTLSTSLDDVEVPQASLSQLFKLSDRPRLVGSGAWVLYRYDPVPIPIEELSEPYVDFPLGSGSKETVEFFAEDLEVGEARISIRFEVVPLRPFVPGTNPHEAPSYRCFVCQ
jgi:hypothetical protein